ncbi:type II secretion system protein [Sporolactobacillus sp. STSJ-5]|uniref:type II secretion system protein n=1 Tax=Sporolactobacillus sp. STSJ-5 TaxID=2965076 RepID=UPI00272A45CA|nr:prepilin-type N-terminal cleavage/methylation domain-containing protein [Sporolactobacillus sp. STSJ-5]
MLKKIMQKANAKKNQKGFTLIELLAVIVILAILAAIAIPSVISIVGKQNNKAAVQDALTAIHAAKLYIADHNATGDQTLAESALKPYLDSSSASKLPATFTVKYDSTAKTYTITDASLPSDVVSSYKSGDYVAESVLIDYNN